MDVIRVEAWQVHDTGLVAVPGPFRRLPGGLRHHQGRGEPWPVQVTLEVDDEALVVPGVGRWPRSEVGLRPVGDGPPVTFVIEVPGASHLLAAPADAATRALLAALAG